MESKQWYQDWHNNPKHARVHWSLLVVTGVLVTLSLVSSINSAYKIAGASHGGAHITTHYDTIPDFCETPTKTSTGSGNWSNASTWSPSGVPSTNDKVTIQSGHTVIYDTNSSSSLDCVGVKGILNFRTDINTKLTVGTLVIYETGILNVGTLAAPVATGVTAEIVIANKPINTGFDPDQYGTGLIAFGTIRMSGSPIAQTFIRLAAEPMAGTTTLQLSQAPTNWRVGDRIIVPDTRHLIEGEYWSDFRPRWEDRTIASISGTTITLSSPLTYDHGAGRNADGSIAYYPHVGDVTRNVIIRSENPGGTRGHTMFTNRADVDIRYVQFQDLGRTTNAVLDPVNNHIGRYPLHIHHLIGPANPSNTGYQFKLIGNAIVNSEKWPVTIHNSHYGLIQDNVVYNGTGGGYVTEMATESYNEFLHNFGVGIIGNGDSRSNDGRDGSMFWFNGFNNIVKDNVAASGAGTSQSIVTSAGFYFQRGSPGNFQVKVPLRRGVDAENGIAGVDYQIVESASLPIRQFENNEAYGVFSTGLTFWYLSATSGNPGVTTSTTTVKDFTAWNIWEEGYFGYPSSNIIFDGYTIKGDPNRMPWSRLVGWTAGDYWQGNITMRNVNIQSVVNGIEVSHATEGVFLIESSYLRTTKTNIRITPFYTPGSRTELNPRQVIIKNVRFDSFPGRRAENIKMFHEAVEQNNLNWVQRLDVYVIGYNQNASDNFRLYSNEQLPNRFIPQTFYSLYYPQIYNFEGCPVSDLTNQQCWDTYGISVGSINPSTICTTPLIRPEVIGWACPASGAMPAPLGLVPQATMTITPSTINAGQSATLTWSVVNGNAAAIDGGVGAVPMSGSRVVTPTRTRSYMLIATNANGASIAAFPAVTVNGGASQPTSEPPIISIYAFPSAVTPGSHVELRWIGNNQPTTLDHGIGPVSGYSGSHTITASASDVYTITSTSALGTFSAQANVIVGTSIPVPPPVDPTPPTVSITSPAASATVAGNATIIATANDAVGVARVEFYVDGTLKGTDMSAPYSIVWDTTNAGAHPCSGAHTHTLTTRAFDAAGNQGNSAAVVVNMNNPTYCAVGPTVTNLQATFRQGQTFITFNEIVGAGVTYNVYRSTSPITTTSGLTPIATLSQGSGTNRYTGQNFIITDLGSPLPTGTGLLVWTTAQNGAYYYAITNSQSNSIASGTNSITSPVTESVWSVPGAVQIAPVTQPNGAGTNRYYKYIAWEDYATWNHALWGYYGHQFTVTTEETIDASNYLLVNFHSAGNTGYFEPFGFTSIVNGRVALAFADYTWIGSMDPYTLNQNAWTAYYGDTDGSMVHKNTVHRVRRYIKWVTAHPTFNVDINRVYTQGASYGGGGSMHFALWNPDLIAAAQPSIGWVNKDSFSGVAEHGYAGQQTVDGLAWENQMNQQYLIEQFTGDAPPIIYTYNKDDTTVNPTAHTPLQIATENMKQSYAARWRNGNHQQFHETGAWDVIRFRKNEAFPAFANAGNSDAHSVQEGQRNINLDWSSSLHDFSTSSSDNIVDTSTSYGMSFKSLLTDTTATVTIRNAQNFRPAANQTIGWSNADSTGVVIASGNVNADSQGLVTLPNLSIRALGNRLTLSSTGSVTPTPTPVPIVGDLNNDGIVNSLDWSIMNAVWFTNNNAADLNDDGIVNSLDFSILNKNWLK